LAQNFELNRCPQKREKVSFNYPYEIDHCMLAKRIKELREMISELNVLKNKKCDLFLNLIDLTKELDDLIY
jgi:hypothetical protein